MINSNILIFFTDYIYNIGDKERELSVPLTFAFDRHNPVPESKFQLVNTFHGIFFTFFFTFFRICLVKAKQYLKRLRILKRF